MSGEKLSVHRHLLNPKSLSSEEGLCGLCAEKIKGSGYECSECNFSAHTDCANNPPSLVIDAAKYHEHPLTLFTSPVTFICNACGLSGNISPYVCLQCSFMIHQECVDLPKVIKISRHNHRISHTFFLGHGKGVCGVCRQKIDGQYGAYSCSRCPNYVVHSECARRKDVWDGTEVNEGEEEEDDKIEDIEPFRVIDEMTIFHVSHQHALRFEEKVHPENICCSACAFSIASDHYYRCEQCDFFLHERCANVPQRKTMSLHVHPLTLYKDENGTVGSTLSRCDACDLHFSGFRYQCSDRDNHVEFDILCASIPEPFVYQLHTHPLYFTITNSEIEKARICNVCDLDKLPKCMLSCITCEFNLCLACATLPREVKYKYDEHLLSHTIVEDNGDGEYVTWCDICEKQIDKRMNHYKCSDCGPFLHTDCVLGSFRKMKPGVIFTSDGHQYQVVLNDWTSKLSCSQCGYDCREPLLLMMLCVTTDVTIYLCSSNCFTAYVPV